MVSLVVVFWMYVILFAIIGAMRGWARELLVSFSVILALFIISVLERFIPFIGRTLAAVPLTLFWLRLVVVLALVFSTVYLRYHYVIDVIAGIALAAVNVTVSPGLYRWFSGAPGEPGKEHHRAS